VLLFIFTAWFLHKFVNPARRAKSLDDGGEDGGESTLATFAGWYFKSAAKGFPEWKSLESKSLDPGDTGFYKTEDSSPYEHVPCTPSLFEAAFTSYHNSNYAWAAVLVSLAKQIGLGLFAGVGVRISEQYNTELVVALILCLAYAAFVVVVRPHIANLQNMSEVITSLFEIILLIIFFAAEGGSAATSAVPAVFAIIMILIQLTSQSLFIYHLLKALKPLEAPELPAEPEAPTPKPQPTSSDDGKSSQTSLTQTTKKIVESGTVVPKPQAGASRELAARDDEATRAAYDDARSDARSDDDASSHVIDVGSVISDDRSDVQSETDSVVSSVMTEMSEWHWEPYVGRWIWKKGSVPGEAATTDLPPVGEDDMLWT